MVGLRGLRVRAFRAGRRLAPCSRDGRGRRSSWCSRCKHSAEGMEDRSVGGVERGRVEWRPGLVCLEKPGKGFVKASGPGGIEREEGVAPFARELVGIDGGCPSKVVAGGYEEASMTAPASQTKQAAGQGHARSCSWAHSGKVEASGFGYGGADEDGQGSGDFGQLRLGGHATGLLRGTGRASFPGFGAKAGIAGRVRRSACRRP